MDYTKVGVIFDCDGTLIDSMDAWRALEADLAQRAGVALTKADKDALNTMTIPECGHYFHDQLGLGSSGAEVEELINDLMLDFYSHKAKARPGAVAFVESLADKGVHMTVASSTPKPLLEAGLAHVGIAPHLDAIVSVDDVGHSKREPHVFRRAREIMGTPIETTWGVEDSTYAIQTLHNAGFRTLAVYDCDVSGTYADLSANADWTISSFEEITPEEFLSYSHSHNGN